MIQKLFPQLNNEIIEKVEYGFVVFIVLFELFSPVNVAAAASEVMDDADEGVILNRQYIAPAAQPSIMLEGGKLEASQEAWRQERQEAKPEVATVYMMASAYNSLPNQTDGSPYKTAIGSLTRDGVVASNYFPIGTRLRLPDVFGDQEFRVEDRMNQRYFKTLDVWMDDYAEAKQFGRRYVRVDIVEYGKGRGVE